MENAAKALLIAGGILLAIITLSLVNVLYNNLNKLQTAQQEKKEQEQLIAFNREYEAYNKSLLYGTDVITVVNKAINNNKNMNVETEITNKYYVNVTLVLETTCEGEEKTTYVDPTKPQETTTWGSSKLDGVTRGKEYNLGTSTMNENVVNFFNETAEKTVERYPDKTVETIPAIVRFKSLIFTCKELKYDENNGRVKEIKFVECKKKP